MQQLDYIVKLMRIAVEDAAPVQVTGRVIEVKGTIIKAVVPTVKLGEICMMRNPDGQLQLQAEVVGFTQNAALLSPIGDMFGISTVTEVVPTGRTQQVAVGPELLGRILDGLGRPLDVRDKGPLHMETRYPVYAEPPDPLSRRMIKDPLPLGVRAI
ncbi:MAG: EscN/YscN/HrcN family type III secretion system ATPase, partial [Alphaproteobacteria bacterium]|nr:EscN/YscN/HrcN family type III secretion system ATPase [Alphaproteobacteria bacterium]